MSNGECFNDEKECVKIADSYLQFSDFTEVQRHYSQFHSSYSENVYQICLKVIKRESMIVKNLENIIIQVPSNKTNEKGCLRILIVKNNMKFTQKYLKEIWINSKVKVREEWKWYTGSEIEF